jgi:hypothetical protein
VDDAVLDVRDRRRGDHADRFERGVADVLEQPLPGPEEDRDDVEVELVEQPGREVLLHPWIKMFKDIHDQYIPKLPWDGNVLYGEALAYTFAEALQMAGENPTRQGIVDAIKSGKLKGPGLVPFRYGEDSHAGFTGEALAEIKGGKLVEEGEPQVTDSGSGDVTAGDQPAEEPPANGVPSAGG